ncbi:MAG: hypothetical protein ACYDCL_01580 [Myxococcales bacterium]
MNVFCKHTLAGAVAALFAGCVWAGCSNTPSATDGGTGSAGTSGGTSSANGTTGSQGNGSSNSSSSSGGGTGGVGSSGGSSGGSSSGGSCIPLNASCTKPGQCCSNLSCQGQTGSETCQPCGSLASACCDNSTCNAGYVCDTSGDAQNDTCITAPVDAGCVLSAAGGPCVTKLDCSTPNVCLPASDGGGYCGPLTVPSAACLPNGSTCPSATNAGEPCCGGYCNSSHQCAPRGPCGVGGQGCSTNLDCCNDFQCAVGDGGADAGGVCVPSCQGQLGVCNGNSDCCTQQGLVCLGTGLAPGQGPAAICDYLSNASPVPPACEAVACSPNECTLGSFCQVSDAGVDPCAAAGYTCDFANHVCREPSELENCKLGGAPCQPLVTNWLGQGLPSTVTDLQCLPFPGQPGTTACLQPCGLGDPYSGTADCVDGLTKCEAATGGGVCSLVFGSTLNPNNCSSTSPLFGSCTYEVPGDGYCAPINLGNGVYGLCVQGTLDGGGPGSPCTDNPNRQNGGLCSPQSFCLGGICQPNCNAGTSGSPACAQPDAGAPEACFADYGETTDSADQGTCTVNCDFTDPDGGGCSSPDGVPEKCIPSLFLTGADSPNGVCAQEPAQPTPSGQVCGTSIFIDPCVPGSLCIGPTFGPDTCAKICDVSGQGTPCPLLPDGGRQTCTALGISQTATSQYLGYCQ